MRSWLFLGLIVVGCGGKKEPKAAAAPPPVTEAPPPEPEAEPEPGPPADNANVIVTVKTAGGDVKTGLVKRIERSVDWFADEGWTSEPDDLMIIGEGAGTEKKIPWTEVATITVKPGSTSDLDCVYDSNFTPWMYDCTLKTAGTLKTKDGATWSVTNRHKWKLTFDDGSTSEFWLYKHPAREQDNRELDIDSTEPENVELYKTLSDRAKKEASTSLVVSVTVQ